jgi:hypothetical protein
MQTKYERFKELMAYRNTMARKKKIRNKYKVVKFIDNIIVCEERYSSEALALQDYHECKHYFDNGMSDIDCKIVKIK